jgi:hypothetical protein
VPLYHQEVGHESLIVTGLLVCPPGLGMLMVSPWTAQLTQRFGGGRVAVVGVGLLCLSTVAPAGTAYWWAPAISAASLIPVLVLARAENQKPGEPESAAEELAEAEIEPLGA